MGFALPTELRLQVYKHLIVASLASGTPQHISGLFFSCRTIYTEMEADIAKIRPFLVAARRWLDVQPDGEPLQIELLPGSGFLPGPIDGKISILSCVFWKYSDPDSAPFSIRRRRAALAPAFRLPWSTISLSVRTPPQQRGFEALHHTAVILRGLFTKRPEVDGGPLYQNVNRLTLDCRGNIQVEQDPENLRGNALLVSQIVAEIRQYLWTTRGYKKFWVRDVKGRPGGI